MNDICKRCQLLPVVESAPKVVHFVFPIDLLRDKVKDILRKTNFEFFENNELLTVFAQDFRSFLTDLRMQSGFSTPELNDIMCITLNEGEDLSFTNFSKLKPLSYWFSLIDAQDYFDILKEQRLLVYFQPVLESKNLSIIGYEALIRGISKDGSLVSPKFLFDTAEKTNTLFYLDRFCRETVLRTAAEKDMRSCKIFVNFIPTSIYDPNVCLQSTIRFAKEVDFEPSNIVFEVVESYKVTDIDLLSNILNFYRANGFLVALDDVGSGYSNLNMLVHLRPDIVKIDREIIRNIQNDELKRSIFKAVVSLCKEANIFVLAEGVETVDEYNYVKEHVDFVQGFLFAKPAPEPLREIKLQV